MGAILGKLSRVPLSSNVLKHILRPLRQPVQAASSDTHSSVPSRSSSFTSLGSATQVTTSLDGSSVGYSTDSYDPYDDTSNASLRGVSSVSTLSEVTSSSSLRNQLRSTFETLPSHRIWLDELPPEVGVRVAEFLTTAAIDYSYVRRRCTEALLSLAETSPAQRHAVLAAINYSVLLDDDMAQQAGRWAQVFSSDVESLEVEFFFQGHCPENQDESSKLFGAILRQSSLRRLAMDDTWTQLWGLRKAVLTLRRLHLTLFDTFNIRPLLCALTGLFLKKLHLECACADSGSGECYFLSMVRDGSQSLPLYDLVTLSLSCGGGHNNGEAAEWPIFGSLPRLRDLSLGIGVQTEALPQVRALKYVQIRYVKGGASLGARIGQPVTQILSPQCELDSEGLLSLTACPKLAYLSVRLKQGAEENLHKIAGSLELLTLSFGCSDESEGGPCCYGEPVLGSLLRAVHQAPNLRFLFIDQARIRLSEVVAMLKHLGTRLERVGLSVDKQDEPRWKRLMVVMETIGKYNRSLTFLGCRGESPEEVDMSEEEAQVLFERLVRLQRQLPNLDTGSLGFCMLHMQKEEKRGKAHKALTLFAERRARLDANPY